MEKLVIESPTIDTIIQRMLDGMGYHDAMQVSVEDFRRMAHALVNFEHNWNRTLVQMFSDHLKYCTSLPAIRADDLELPIQMNPKGAPGAQPDVEEARQI